MSTETNPSAARPQSGAEEVTIIVNAREHRVPKDELSFDEIVAFYENPPTGPNIYFTVTYRRGHGNKEGSVVVGGSVKVKDGMIFNVTATDRS